MGLKSFFQKKKDQDTSPLSSTSNPELKNLFLKFDTDNDGSLTMKELSKMLAALGCPTTDDGLTTLLQELDTDADGLIGFDEFMKIAKDGDMTDDLKEAFDVFDVNKDGKITAEELHAVMRMVGGGGGHVSIDECRKMVSGVDVNGDGVVCFEEFEKMMAMGIGNNSGNGDGVSSSSYFKGGV